MSKSIHAHVLAATVLIAFAPATALAVFTENFSVSPSALTLNPGSAQTTFVGTAGKLDILMTGGFEASSAYTIQSWADTDFTLSVDVAPSAMLFTSGWAGIYAYGSDQFDGNGYTARVINVDFSVDNFRLEIVSFGNVIAQSAIFDLVQGFEDAYTTFTLSMSGTFVANDLNLSATLTPNVNPNNLPVISIGAVTVAGANLDGDQWGIRQTKAGNTFNISYDNLAISAVPEPAAFSVLAGLTGLVFASARRRRR